MSVIAMYQITFINPNTFVDFFKYIIHLINASDIEFIKPKTFLYLALAVVECCPVVCNASV